MKINFWIYVIYFCFLLKFSVSLSVIKGEIISSDWMNLFVWSVFFLSFSLVFLLFYSFNYFAFFFSSIEIYFSFWIYFVFFFLFFLLNSLEFVSDVVAFVTFYVWLINGTEDDWSQFSFVLEEKATIAIQIQSQLSSWYVHTCKSIDHILERSYIHINERNTHTHVCKATDKRTTRPPESPITSVIWQ